MVALASSKIVVCGVKHSMVHIVKTAVAQAVEQARECCLSDVMQGLVRLYECMQGFCSQHKLEPHQGVSLHLQDYSGVWMCDAGLSKCGYVQIGANTEWTG